MKSFTSSRTRKTDSDHSNCGEKSDRQPVDKYGERVRSVVEVVKTPATEAFARQVVEIILGVFEAKSIPAQLLPVTTIHPHSLTLLLI